jgi:hypothetical protein
VRAFERRQKPLHEASDTLEAAKMQGFLAQQAKKARKTVTKLCRRL